MFAGLVRLVMLFGLVLCACKTQAPATIKPGAQPVEAQAPAHVEAPPIRAPVRDQFEQDDEVDDPAQALQALRHNCCDEMPADQVRAAVRETAEHAEPANKARTPH
jgi:hypothetical protein